MQTLTSCNTKVTSKRTAVSQFKGKFNGAMEEMLQKVQKVQALTHCDANVMSTRTTAGQFKCEFKGAMEDMSGKVQNANTHSLRRQSHEHTHSSRSVQGLVQWGDGGNAVEGSK